MTEQMAPRPINRFRVTTERASESGHARAILTLETRDAMTGAWVEKKTIHIGSTYLSRVIADLAAAHAAFDSERQEAARRRYEKGKRP